MSQSTQVADLLPISLPLPGYPDLQTANVYLLGPRPLTLIDAAPKFPGAFEFIQEEARRGGYDLSRVERILLTHGHVDHFGLVERIRQEADRPIPCYLHTEELHRVTSTKHYREILSSEGDAIMAMVDMPQREAEKIRDRFSLFDLLCDPIPDALGFEDGEVFRGEGYELNVVHCPGHTPGSCCFHEPRQRILFSGDHLLKHVTPNPLFEFRKDLLRFPGYQSLKAYLASLDRVAKLEVLRVLPGHGEEFSGLTELVAGYRRHHRERADRLWGALKKGNRPIYHLIGEVFDFVPENDVFLAISEILVHLELLIDQGRAELVDSGPPALYRATG